jgi:hypothetical protein
MAKKAPTVRRTTGKGIANKVTMVLDRLDGLSRVERITPDQLQKLREAIGLKLLYVYKELDKATLPREASKFSFDDDEAVRSLERDPD